MAKCLNCENEAPADFITCSSACALEWRSGGAQLLTSAELAVALGVDPRAVGQWKRFNRIPWVDTPEGSKFNLDEVKHALAKPVTRPTASEAVRMEEAPGPATPTEEAFLASVRKEMLEAARQTARDVVLAHADRAKAAKQHELRAQLLDDFIHMEQGLSMVFGERGHEDDR